MNMYKGEPTSILRSRLLGLIDELEEHFIGDDYFIEEVFRALGRNPADYLATDYELDERDNDTYDDAPVYFGHDYTDYP